VSGAVASPRARQVAELRSRQAARAIRGLARVEGRRAGTGQLERLAPSRPHVEVLSQTRSRKYCKLRQGKTLQEFVQEAKGKLDNQVHDNDSPGALS
jgi:hypothetical protein